MFLTLVVFLSASSIGYDGGSITSLELDDYLRRVQLSRRTCGPVCLWYCLQRRGRPVEINELIDRAELSEEGVRLQHLVELCRRHGLPAEALKSSGKDLASLPVPSILLAPRHCVVYDGIDVPTGRVRIFEPSSRRIVFEPLEKTTSHWSGEAIVFSPPRASRPAAVSYFLLGVAAVAGPWWLVRRRRRSSADC